MSAQEPDVLHDRIFTGRSVRASRFVGCDLEGVVVRGSEVAGMEIDSPRLMEGGSRLLVNGVDVVPLVDAELNRRFPGRELRTAKDPGGLRKAWAALERTWSTTVARAVAMPAVTVDASVDGEWSFAQTLRHLVMATDIWLGKAVLEQDRPYHPLGLRHDSADGAGGQAVLSPRTPSFEEVLEARRDRQAAVRAFVATATAETVARPRKNPHSPEHAVTVLSCLRTILEEEWEHHRYAGRDLDSLAETGATPQPAPR